ncbi:MAG TPA: hypothetical protein HA330_06040 [Candidatus Thalassarchaeaceae archaeon]|nr:MAG TPA: hypothetical protein D7H85_06035 [Candidatus Poseidoniales archaeon]HII49432.1 hypothetical protein [Candidatus Thalassarchaeaceae archaeon]|tara:strand:+ start:398 stop:823 length:426 start_codon:yes stop_codon:yes gene_type:complete
MSLRRLSGAGIGTATVVIIALMMIEGEESPAIEDRLRSIIIQALWTAMMAWMIIAGSMLGLLGRGRAPWLQIGGLLFLSLSTLGILAIIGEIPTEDVLGGLTIRWAGLATGAFFAIGYTLSTLTVSMDEEIDPLLLLGREQ